MTSSDNTATIVGRALLVSNDSAASEQIASGFRKFAILPEICTHVPTALSLVCTRRYEAVVVDVACGEWAGDVLERVRISPSNRNSVTFIVGNARSFSGPSLRPNFVMQRPLNDALVESTLKAALGLIIHEYRRYFRCAIACPVTIRIGNDAVVECEMINISEGGFAVNTSIILSVGALATVRFSLPGESAAFDAQSEICWCDKKGRAGFQFRPLPPDQEARLRKWLTWRIEQGLPEPIARLFQKNK